MTVKGNNHSEVLPNENNVFYLVNSKLQFKIVPDLVKNQMEISQTIPPNQTSDVYQGSTLIT